MTTFNRVLCPVDFSDASAHAVRYAREIASWCGARLVVQHVYAPLVVSPPGLPDVVETLPAGELARLTNEARAFARRAGCSDPLPDVVVDTGNAADEIVGRTKRDGTDLLVMGTHGASGFKHLVLGSVTEKVLRQVACPVLTVPPHVDETHAVVPFRRILCAVDFSDWSLSALDRSATLAAATRATLIALHVIEWPWPEPPAPAFDELPAPQASALQEYRRYVIAQATARLRATVTTVIDDRCDVTIEIAHGKPHIELVRLASERQVDLISLGVHGRSKLDLAVFGSTTNQVVRHAACPVLTVRRPDE